MAANRCCMLGHESCETLWCAVKNVCCFLVWVWRVMWGQGDQEVLWTEALGAEAPYPPIPVLFGSTKREMFWGGSLSNAVLSYQRNLCCAARKEWHHASFVLLACMLACTQQNTTTKDCIMQAPLFSGITTGVKFTLYTSVGENL